MKQESEIQIIERIRKCAASAFDMNRGHDLIGNARHILSQRSYLAYLLDRDLLKDRELGLEQFRKFDEILRQHLSL